MRSVGVSCATALCVLLQKSASCNSIAHCARSMPHIFAGHAVGFDTFFQGVQWGLVLQQKKIWFLQQKNNQPMKDGFLVMKKKQSMTTAGKQINGHNEGRHLEWHMVPHHPISCQGVLWKQ